MATFRSLEEKYNSYLDTWFLFWEREIIMHLLTKQSRMHLILFALYLLMREIQPVVQLLISSRTASLLSTFASL